MKAGSIQLKFFITIVSAILAISIFAGGISIYEVDNYIQKETENLVKITGSNEALQINDVFGDIEKSVRIMESYVLSFFDSAADAEDRDRQSTMIRLADEMFIDVAKNTSGIIAYYLRLDPTISDSTAGLFYSKTEGTDELVKLVPTDISIYDRDDVEHVGWFWQPYDAGRPIWMEPYKNQNLSNISMISYIIPLYCEGRFIGVVGMDYDFNILVDKVHDIKIYENGFAHLMLDDVVIHNHEERSLDLDEEYLQASEKLTNGMTLTLYASIDDIRHIRYDIAYNIILWVVLLTIVFLIVVLLMAEKITTPLKKLSDAASKISKGDYDVEIVHGETYEVQQLGAAFENMIANLQEHREFQHILAYRDALTGLRNATSYKEWVIKFDTKIKEKDVAFGVVVFDLNYLKETNDTYGHNIGNKLIATASHIISEAFKCSPAFRIGGDEFMVILQGSDMDERDALLEKFDSDCESALVEADNATIRVVIAKGVAIFDPAVDTQFSDVFNRADFEMYKNKKSIKMANVQKQVPIYN